MPTSGLACEEWTVFSEGTVMLLAKHNTPRYPARVLWTDIANTLDGGGEAASEGEKEASLLGCGTNGGQLGVQVDKGNKAYQTEEYKSAKYTFDILLKVVRNQ
jgi:hypothetical protein